MPLLYMTPESKSPTQHAAGSRAWSLSQRNQDAALAAGGPHASMIGSAQLGYCSITARTSLREASSSATFRASSARRASSAALASAASRLASRSAARAACGFNWGLSAMITARNADPTASQVLNAATATRWIVLANDHDGPSGLNETHCKSSRNIASGMHLPAETAPDCGASPRPAARLPPPAAVPAAPSAQPPPSPCSFPIGEREPEIRQLCKILLWHRK